MITMITMAPKLINMEYSSGVWGLEGAPDPAEPDGVDGWGVRGLWGSQSAGADAAAGTAAAGGSGCAVGAWLVSASGCGVACGRAGRPANRRASMLGRRRPGPVPFGAVPFGAVPLGAGGVALAAQVVAVRADGGGLAAGLHQPAAGVTAATRGAARAGEQHAQPGQG